MPGFLNGRNQLYTQRVLRAISHVAERYAPLPFIHGEPHPSRGALRATVPGHRHLCSTYAPLMKRSCRGVACRSASGVAPCLHATRRIIGHRPREVPDCLRRIDVIRGKPGFRQVSATVTPPPKSRNP
eukprot:7220687-Prymnesium_polylepis.1